MKKSLSLALCAGLLISTSSFADDKSDIAELKEQVKALQETAQVLTDETSDLKTGFNYTTVDSEKSFSGLGAAASKVYYSKSPLSIGGYGEMYYSTNTKGDSTIDVYRFIPYIGYKFSDNVILNTEIEFEHGGSRQSDDPELSGGYAVVEFMYLDFLINEHLNARLGNFLVPMGLINQRHEPTLFTTVQRPDTSKYLIPSTWSESGVMIFGNITDDINYKLAGITALDTEANGYKWLRNGRAGTLKQKNKEFATVARVDYTGTNGLLVGASAYYGASGTGENSNTLMYDVHGDYKVSGFRAYGVYTQTIRSNTGTISTTPTNTAVKEAKGGFLNLSYDVLSTTDSSFSLPVFIQYESVNPQAKFADGSSFDAVKTTTVGINFFPQKQVVLKADYAMADNDYSNTGTKIDTFSLSMGFIF